MTEKKASGLEDAAKKAGTLVNDDADENLPPKSVQGPGGRAHDGDNQRQPTRQTERVGRERPGQVDPQ